jgi:hypothetical protein
LKSYWLPGRDSQYLAGIRKIANTCRRPPPSPATGGMASSPSEHEIQQRIRLASGRGAVRLWRNNTGALVDQQGRYVRFGLCKGSSDLIGLRALEITPELVGQRLAQFVALEIKTAQGVLSPVQRAFLRLVQELGGVAAVCRSVEEAEQLLGTPRQVLLGH